MTWESGSTDQQRLRAGYAVLSIGLMVLVFAWGMAVWRGPQGEGAVAVRHEKLDPPEPDRILPVVGAGMVLSGVCLVGVLALSVVAFLRISRRYRDQILRPPARPSQTAGVWEMHQVPDDLDEDGGGDEGDAP